MKLLTIAALAAALFAAEESKPADKGVTFIDSHFSQEQLTNAKADPDKLTPDQIKEWKVLDARLSTPDPTLVAKKQAVDAAKLAWYEAKEAYEKAVETANAEVNAQFAKLQADAKCPGCLIDKKELKWIRPQAPTTK